MKHIVIDLIYTYSIALQWGNGILRIFSIYGLVFVYQTGLIEAKLLAKLIHLAALVCHHHHINNYQGQSPQNHIDIFKKNRIKCLVTHLCDT